MAALAKLTALDAGVVHARAEDAKGLAVGAHVPEIELLTSAGEPFDLHASLHAKPTLMIFYRGGWCPYCNRHLTELGKVDPDLRALGYQILAISPDLPETIAETA